VVGTGFGTDDGFNTDWQRLADFAHGGVDDLGTTLGTDAITDAVAQPTAVDLELNA
jgi:hypothetical protein